MQTKAERMALIREAAKKFQAKQTRAARFAREEREYDREFESRKKKEASEIYWTDSREYASKYYGDVYRATTRFDNDWD